jgi:hypothetical protein
MESIRLHGRGDQQSEMRIITYRTSKAENMKVGFVSRYLCSHMLASIQSMKPSPSSKRPRQPNIPRACTHIHIKRPSRHLPRLISHIPVAKILPANIKSDSTRSARHEVHLLETTELLRRRSRSARRQTKIQLSDLGAGHSAVVCDLCGNGGDGIEETDGAPWAWGGAAGGLVGV